MVRKSRHVPSGGKLLPLASTLLLLGMGSAVAALTPHSGTTQAQADAEKIVDNAVTLPASSSAKPVSQDKNNALAQAEDGFGNQAGKESIGIYSDSNVRGFSPSKAGNLRIEGMYFDRRAYLGHLLLEGSKVRVGTTVNAYPFPAPTGIVDYQLRKPAQQAEFSYALELEHSARGAGDRAADINALLPLSQPGAAHYYGVSLAASVLQETTPHREASLYRSLALVGHLRSQNESGPGFEFLPFLSIDQVPYEMPHSFWYTQEGQLPPASLQHLPDMASLKANWMRDHGLARTYGAIYKHRFEHDWQLQASLIRSESAYPRRGSHVFEQQPNGRWLNTFYSERDNQKQASSSEIRVSKAWRNADAQHQVHAVWRARQVEQRYGGEAYQELPELDLQSGRLRQPYAAQGYDFHYTERTLDKIKQHNLGLAYDYQSQRGGANLGLLKSYYDMQSWNGDGAERQRSQNRAQPLLGYWNLSLNLPASFSVYAGQTQGLEESGVAPVSASNRFLALPAIQTRQSDLGLRWQSASESAAVTAVLGWFDVSKPHFGFDAENTYMQTGQVRHRGMEASLALKPNEQWNLMLAAVFLDARIAGAQNSAVKARPVASQAWEGRAYLDYKLSSGATSFDLGLHYTSPQVTSETSNRRLATKYLAQLGLRQQVKLAGLEAQLRLQIDNLFNRDTWEVDSDNTFIMGRPRSYRLLLSMNH